LDKLSTPSSVAQVGPPALASHHATNDMLSAKLHGDSNAQDEVDSIDIRGWREIQYARHHCRSWKTPGFASAHFQEPICSEVTLRANITPQQFDTIYSSSGPRMPDYTMGVRCNHGSGRSFGSSMLTVTRL